ncbi:MAG TPA: hypothetical protein VFU63_00630 [Ktedonobacterales bacterium]|nr:hypothetical protein [Ktedonobacterales bacterium]
MAREWRELGAIAFPDEPFNRAWEVYQYAARFIVERTYEIQVARNPTDTEGINSTDVVDWLHGSDAGAVAAAKAHMAFCLGAAAFLDDLKGYGKGSALLTLLEETRQGEFTP